MIKIFKNVFFHKGLFKIQKIYPFFKLQSFNISEAEDYQYITSIIRREFAKTYEYQRDHSFMS